MVTTVLVIDDDPAISRLIRFILIAEDFSVEREGSGEAALALLSSSSHPDVILLDLSMPDMDGRNVFREARQMGVACPIVFCSAFGASDANQELGGQGALDKPFTPDALIAAVRELTGPAIKRTQM